MTFTFYIAERQLTVYHQPITLPGGYRAFIRVEINRRLNIEQALDAAKPMPGESVMNTHDLLYILFPEVSR